MPFTDRTWSAARRAVFDAPAHERASVVTFCVQNVVRPTEQHDVVGARGPSTCKRHDVVELQPTARLAARCVGRNEAALPVGSGPSLTPDVMWNVPGVLGRTLRGGGAGLWGERELSFLLLRDQQLERPLEQRLEIARWIAMAPQVLRLSEERSHAFASGEAELVSFRAPLHDRPRVRLRRIQVIRTRMRIPRWSWSRAPLHDRPRVRLRRIQVIRTRMHLPQ